MFSVIGLRGGNGRVDIYIVVRKKKRESSLQICFSSLIYVIGICLYVCVFVVKLGTAGHPIHRCCEGSCRHFAVGQCSVL